MAITNLFLGNELDFFVKLIFSFISGFLIGKERESRGKDAGVGTHGLVIAGAMIFTFISIAIEPENNLRIAANILTGVGFLGAGIILKKESGRVANLTTAASIWFSAAIGMAIGIGWYFIALLATIYAVIVPNALHKRPSEGENSAKNQFREGKARNK